MSNLNKETRAQFLKRMEEKWGNIDTSDIPPGTYRLKVTPIRFYQDWDEKKQGPWPFTKKPSD